MFGKKIQALTNEANTLLTAHEAAGTVPNEQEMGEIQAKLDQAEELKNGAAKMSAMRGQVSASTDFLDTSTGRASAPAPIAQASQIEVGKSQLEKDPMCGYSKPAEFFHGVMKVSTGQMSIEDDPRLKYLSAVGQDEQKELSNPDGGFLVPETMQPGLLMVDPETDPTADRVTRIPMQTPTIKINARVDKDHATSVAGGIVVFRREETALIKSSKEQFEQVTLTANSLMGINYVTEELLNDSPLSVAAIIANSFGQAFRDRIFREKINGTGVGEFQGVTKSDAFIGIDRVATGKIDFKDTLNMRARCHGYGNAIWLANHDTFPEIAATFIKDTNGAAGTPAWNFSMSEDTPDTFLGRPIFFTEYVGSLGTDNDLLLGDWSQYLEASLGGIETAESIHVRFETNEKAFRFGMRNDGRSWWNSPLTPINGATLSPFIGLNAQQAS